MSNCINNINANALSLIGIRGSANAVYNTKDLTVNDLSGISLKQASAITNAEYTSGMALLESKVNLAHKLVLNDVLVSLQTYFKESNILYNVNINNFISTTKFINGSTNGLRLKTGTYSTAKLKVNTVYVYINETIPLDIYIKDGNTVTTFNTSITGGQINEIEINYTAVNNVIDIYTLDNYNAHIGFLSGNYSFCNSCGGGFNKIGIDVYGLDGTTINSTIAGIGVDVDLVCETDTILCKLLNYMKLLVWYRSGILILQEHLASNRLNGVAVFGKEEALKLVTLYESEYLRELKSFSEKSLNIIKNMCSECFQAKGLIQRFVKN